MSAGKCASWACSAAMAFNVTASLFSGFSTSSSSSISAHCRALDGNVGCSAKHEQLLFGNTTGMYTYAWIYMHICA